MIELDMMPRILQNDRDAFPFECAQTWHATPVRRTPSGRRETVNAQLPDVTWHRRPARARDGAPTFIVERVRSMARAARERAQDEAQRMADRNGPPSRAAPTSPDPWAQILAEVKREDESDPAREGGGR